MRAVLVEGDALRIGELPDPVPAAGEVVVRVRATAVNRADLMQRRGLYPPPPGASPILGLECAGEIEAVGEGVTFSVGDRVCALLAGGGYAERVAVPAGQVLPIPAGLGFAEAAALPEVACTVWGTIVDEAALKGGERVVLHAAASGVGTMAIQVVHALGGRVFAIAGSPDKVARCIALGAEAGADRKAGPWRSAVEAWAPAGVDIVLDPVGGTLPDDVRVMGVDGRIVLIGLMGGLSAELDLVRVLKNRIRVIGSTLRNRSLQAKARIVAGVKRDVWPLVESGRVKPVIDVVMPIEEIEAAHQRVAADQNIGKVVLVLDRP